MAGDMQHVGDTLRADAPRRKPWRTFRWCLGATVVGFVAGLAVADVSLRSQRVAVPLSATIEFKISEDGLGIVPRDLVGEHLLQWEFGHASDGEYRARAYMQFEQCSRGVGVLLAESNGRNALVESMLTKPIDVLVQLPDGSLQKHLAPIEWVRSGLDAVVEDEGPR